MIQIAAATTVRRRERGVGLVEVMVALMIFSTMLTGLITVQIHAMRASSDAVQRSIAVLFARDMLARIRSNPAFADHYVSAGLGHASTDTSAPVRDCRRFDCDPAALAQFDLWQWASNLRGDATSVGSVGGLHYPVACLDLHMGRLTLDLSWRGIGSGTATNRESCQLPAEHFYDDPAGSAGNGRWQSRLSVSTLIDSGPG